MRAFSLTIFSRHQRQTRVLINARRLFNLIITNAPAPEARKPAAIIITSAKNKTNNSTYLSSPMLWVKKHKPAGLNLSCMILISSWRHQQQHLSFRRFLPLFPLLFPWSLRQNSNTSSLVGDFRRFFLFFVNLLPKQQLKYKQMSSNSEALMKAANNGDVDEVNRLISLKCSPDTVNGLFVSYMERTVAYNLGGSNQQQHLLCFFQTKTSWSPQPAGENDFMSWRASPGNFAAPVVFCLLEVVSRKSGFLNIS